MSLSPKFKSPVSVPPAKGNLVAILLVTVVLKFASSFKAAANSLSVSNAAGALSVKFAIAVVTNAVLATVVSLSPADAVATVTVLPVRSKVPANFAAVILVSASEAVLIAPEAITLAVIFVVI